MKIAGIVAEYNPFHKGHAYHIAQTKIKTNANAIMVVMSGNAVQRGAFAIQDKWSRARHAVENGADLVCELPYIYAGQTAEIFASGGVKLLAAADCDYLSFGAEDDAPGAFDNISEILCDEPDAFKTSLHKHLNEGLSFPAARQKAIASITGDTIAELLRKPNNLLAIEYLKALRRLNITMKPVIITRIGSAHGDSEYARPFPSATAIRRAIYDNKLSEIDPFLPGGIDSFDVPLICRQQATCAQMIFADLLTATPKDLRTYPGMTEGLEFSLINAVREAKDLDSIIDAVSSKRCPKSKIRRILMHRCLCFRKLDFEVLSQKAKSPEASPPYLRVLAFNATGRKIIRNIQKKGCMPVLTNLHSNQTALDSNGRSALQFDCRSTDLFYLLRGDNHRIHSDYFNHPINTEVL